MSVWVVRHALLTLEAEVDLLRQGVAAVEQCRDQLRRLMGKTPSPGDGVAAEFPASEATASGSRQRLVAAIAVLDGEGEQLRQMVATTLHCQEQLAVILGGAPAHTQDQADTPAVEMRDHPATPTSPAPRPDPTSSATPHFPRPEVAAAEPPPRPRWTASPRKESHIAALGLKRGAINRVILTFMAEVRGEVEAYVVATAVVKGRIGEDSPSYRYVFDTLVPTTLGRMVQKGLLVRHKVRNRYLYSLAPQGALRRG